VVCVYSLFISTLQLSAEEQDRVRVGEEREIRAETMGREKGAIGKEREGLWGVFLSWREIAL